MSVLIFALGTLEGYTANPKELTCEWVGYVIDTWGSSGDNTSQRISS